jgi:hypothetical protein
MSSFHLIGDQPPFWLDHKEIDEHRSVFSFVVCYFTAVSKQQEESAARKVKITRHFLWMAGILLVYKWLDFGILPSIRPKWQQRTCSRHSTPTPKSNLLRLPELTNAAGLPKRHQALGESGLVNVSTLSATAVSHEKVSQCKTAPGAKRCFTVAVLVNLQSGNVTGRSVSTLRMPRRSTLRMPRRRQFTNLVAFQVQVSVLADDVFRFLYCLYSTYVCTYLIIDVSVFPPSGYERFSACILNVS